MSPPVQAEALDAHGLIACVELLERSDKSTRAAPAVAIRDLAAPVRERRAYRRPTQSARSGMGDDVLRRAPIRPGKLDPRATAMAVGTPHSAFGYLLSDCLPGIATPDQGVDVSPLLSGVNVVEIKYKRIAFTTVNTRLLNQDVPDALLECTPTLPHLGNIANDVSLAISCIVLTAICGHARLALLMSPPRSLVLERERLSLFVLAANSTGGHKRDLPVKKDGLLAKPSTVLGAGAWRSPEGPQRSEARAEWRSRAAA